MTVLKFTDVISFSSEDPNHPASNLLKPDNYRKWKCAPDATQQQAFVTLKFEKLSSLTGIDIGNNGSAFIEVLVGREGAEISQVLLVASSFMTPIESRNQTNFSRVRMFTKEKLNKNVAEQKWDRINVVCTQPFNKQMQFGLSFVTIHGPDDASGSSAGGIKLGHFTLNEFDESESISVGSIFARRKEEMKGGSASPLTAAIRAASAAAVSPASGDVKQNKLNPPEAGFYQLKKASTDGSSTVPSQKKTKSEPKDVTLKKTESEPKDVTLSNTEKTKPRKLKWISEEDRIPKKKKKTNDDDKTRNDGRKNPNLVHRNHRDESPKLTQKIAKEAPKLAQKITEETQKVLASSSNPPHQKERRPFRSLMSDVVFVMSGYVNPQRATLRDQLTEMGGKYRADWGPGCTHLICAFTNTPKLQQVGKKGKVVTAKWITDCYQKKIRFPWRRYKLEKNASSDESENEIWADELFPDSSGTTGTASGTNGSKCDGKKPDAKVLSDTDDENTDDEIERALGHKKVTEQNDENYDEDTDVDEDENTNGQNSATSNPKLAEYFTGKVFFLNGKLSSEVLKKLKRYIIAYDGTVEEYMNKKVEFVITEDDWDEHFDEALNENASIKFIRPDWVWRCSIKQKLVSHDAFLISKKR